MTIKNWFLAAAAVALTGCATMAPRYTRPDAPVPDAWPEEPGRGGGRPTADVPWREFFADGRLRELIALALENNRDLRVAVLNVEKSRAQFGIQRAELFPSVDASAGAIVQRVPEDLTGSGEAATVHQYGLDVGLTSWELDLFGRVRSLKDQALERYLASEHAQRSARVSLVSQVATAYLTLAADRERLQLASETLSNQQSSYQLTRSRFDAGIASALDLNQARTSVEAARVDIARYTSLVAQDENALVLAVGSPVPAGLLPQSLSEELTALKDLAPGLPSEVLLGRPDVLEAEGALKGANANIGAARAAFFPRVALTSSVGLGSDELSGLFDRGAGAWSFIPRISVPIFSAGANRAGLKAAEADRTIAVAQYEKTIQTAFREVSDALALRATIDGQLDAQQSLADAAAESHRLSAARYDRGVDSYLAVLDSQRALYAARQNLITTRLSRLTNLATLYKALGGGGND